MKEGITKCKYKTRRGSFTEGTRSSALWAMRLMLFCWSPYPNKIKILMEETAGPLQKGGRFHC